MARKCVLAQESDCRDAVEGNGHPHIAGLTIRSIVDFDTLNIVPSSCFEYINAAINRLKY